MPRRCWKRWLARLTVPLLAAAVMLGGLGPAGCDRSPTTKAKPGEMRIVSLSPALTQMAIDLGLRDKLVGVGAFDPVAPQGVAAVGDLYQLDYERVLSAQPTHVLIQPTREGVPTRLLQLAAENDWSVFPYSIETVDDVLEALWTPNTDSPRAVGHARGLPDRAEVRSRRISSQLAKLGDLWDDGDDGDDGSDRDRLDGVLLLVGLEPITAVGPDTFLGELLVIAGGRNALGERSGLYPVLDREELLVLAPRAVVFVRSTTDEMNSQTASPKRVLAGLDIPAVRDERFYELRDEVALLPSTSMPRVAAKLAKLLHPDAVLQIDAIVDLQRPNAAADAEQQP